MNVEELLERAIDSERRYRRHNKARIEAAIETGGYLMMAKDKLQHGDWLPWLERVGINERTARRRLALAEIASKSDSKSVLDFIERVGGMNAAIEYKNAFIAGWGCLPIALQILSEAYEDFKEALGKGDMDTATALLEGMRNINVKLSHIYAMAERAIVANAST